MPAIMTSAACIAKCRSTWHGLFVYYQAWNGIRPLYLATVHYYRRLWLEGIIWVNFCQHAFCTTLLLSNITCKWIDPKPRTSCFCLSIVDWMENKTSSTRDSSGPALSPPCQAASKQARNTDLTRDKSSQLPHIRADGSVIYNMEASMRRASHWGPLCWLGPL